MSFDWRGIKTCYSIGQLSYNRALRLTRICYAHRWSINSHIQLIQWQLELFKIEVLSSLIANSQASFSLLLIIQNFIFILLLNR